MFELKNDLGRHKIYTFNKNTYKFIEFLKNL